MSVGISNFSIIEALDALRTSIPHWNDRLDELNGQIALRQIELARLEDTERPPTRQSLKNQGSTESLRPRDGDENPFHAAEDDIEAIQLGPFEKSRSTENGSSNGRPDSSKAAGAITPRPPPVNIHKSPSVLKRQSSHHTPPTQARAGHNVLRKRRPESLASVESAIPKYRTRSMIIVYYDSTVQIAFEELVKFVSGSRNSMRRGKMAAKMAEMKRAAEREFAEEEDEDDEDDEESNGENFKVGQNRVAAGPAELAADNEALASKLKFISTRQMGPPRDINQSESGGNPSGMGFLRGARRGENGDIFDVLDKGLEWCQSQCEQGAHHFLREGECGTEITNIKKKLAEIKEVAEKEVEKLKKEQPSAPPVKSPPRQLRGTPRTRESKKPQLRKAPERPKALEVDDMEVDDEGFDDDLELPTKITFKRSGDITL